MNMKKKWSIENVDSDDGKQELNEGPEVLKTYQETTGSTN